MAFQGIDIRQPGDRLVVRCLLQDSAGAIVTSGTTSLRLYEIQSDGTVKSYDFDDNTFKTGALTTETQALTHRQGNNSTTNTGLWTYVLTTLTGFTGGNLYIAHVSNSGASPVVQAREFQFGVASAFNPFDSTRGGLTALPNADADDPGGLIISDAGGFDIDNRAPSATATTNLNKMYDGTGYVAPTAPAMQRQVANIAVTGAALNVVATSATVTTGTETNDYTDTATADGVRHEIDDDTGVLDAYYEFDVGGPGVGTSVDWTGHLLGAANLLAVHAYNWGAAGWDQLGSIAGGAAVDGESTFDLTSAHTGTAGNDGLVRIRFSGTGLTTATLATDRILVGYASVLLATDIVTGGPIATTAGVVDEVATVTDGASQVSVDTLLSLLSGLALASGTIGSTGNDATHVHVPLFTYADDAIVDYQLVLLDDSAGLLYSYWIKGFVQSTALVELQALDFTLENGVDKYWLLPGVKDAPSSAPTPLEIATEVESQLNARLLSSGAAANIEKFYNGVARWVNHTGSAETSGDALEAAISGSVGPVFVSQGVYNLNQLISTNVNLVLDPDTTLVSASGLCIFDDFGFGPLNWTIRGGGNLQTNGVDEDAIRMRVAGSILRAELGTVTVDSTENSPLHIETGEVHVTAKALISTDYDAVIIGGGRIFLDADLIDGGDAGLQLESGGTGDVLVRAGVILGNRTSGVGAAIVMNGSVGIVLEAERIEGLNGGKAIAHTGNTPAYAIVKCPTIKGNISAGKLHLIGATIDASALTAAAVTLTGSDVILQDCHIIMKASETYAITAGSAQSVKVLGQLTITDETGADRSAAVHANVTMLTDVDELFAGSPTVGATEYSLPNASTSLSQRRETGVFQIILDTNAVTGGDLFLFRIYEQPVLAGTQRLLYSRVIDSSMSPIWVCERSFLLKHGWDITLQRTAGSDRIIPYSIRRVG